MTETTKLTITAYKAHMAETRFGSPIVHMEEAELEVRFDKDLEPKWYPTGAGCTPETGAHSVIALDDQTDENGRDVYRDQTGVVRYFTTRSQALAALREEQGKAYEAAKAEARRIELRLVAVMKAERS